jgi:hypothetical protein
MYSRFLAEAGREEAALAARAAAGWTSLAGTLLAASERDHPVAALWSSARRQAGDVLEAEEALWSALAPRGTSA